MIVYWSPDNWIWWRYHLQLTGYHMRFNGVRY